MSWPRRSPTPPPVSQLTLPPSSPASSCHGVSEATPSRFFGCDITNLPPHRSPSPPPALIPSPVVTITAKFDREEHLQAMGTTMVQLSEWSSASPPLQRPVKKPRLDLFSGKIGRVERYPVASGSGEMADTEMRQHETRECGVAHAAQQADRCNRRAAPLWYHPSVELKTARMSSSDESDGPLPNAAPSLETQRWMPNRTPMPGHRDGFMTPISTTLLLSGDPEDFFSVETAVHDKGATAVARDTSCVAAAPRLCIPAGRLISWADGGDEEVLHCHADETPPFQRRCSSLETVSAMSILDEEADERATHHEIYLDSMPSSGTVPVTRCGFEPPEEEMLRWMSTTFAMVNQSLHE